MSRLVGRFEESATLALAAKAKKMAANGADILNFAAGEPDFNTPEPILEAAFQAAREGQTKYTPVAGKPSLREAIARRLAQDYQIDCAASQVMVSNGGKQSIFHFLQAVLEPGDEVIIHRPYWTSFPEMVKMVGGKPVFYGMKSARPDLDELQTILSSRTKLIILNSPGNPSGLVWTREELELLCKALESSSAWLLSDDTYYSLVYSPSEFHSVLKLRPDLSERICVVGASSKSYSMTGWRLGWALAPEPIVQAMVKLQGQVTSGPCSVSQAAAEAAVGAHHSFSRKFCEIFDGRRKKLLEKVKEIEGLTCLEPQGAFYAFLDFSSFMPAEAVTGFCQDLLEKEGLCLVPGEAFGEPAFARMSYAASEEQISAGFVRLKKALKQRLR